MDVHKKGNRLSDIQLLQETIKNGDIYGAMDSTGPPLLDRKSTTANQTPKACLYDETFGWLQVFFLFGTEQLESQLNRSPCR